MKVGYVLLDGCADRPDPRLNYTTPLEAAYSPYLDRLASSSRLGTVTTVGEGVAPESDIAVFNMLGYSFDSGYPGRGVVEAVGAGLGVKDGDLALRTNLASVAGRLIRDRRAGRNLTQEEAKALELDVGRIELRGAEFEYRATVGYRGVVVIRDSRPLSAEISNTDPAYSRVAGFGAAKQTSARDEVLKCVAEKRSAAAERAAELVNEFSEKAMRALEKSEVNGRRAAEGKMPANCLLMRDAGDHLPELQPFKERFGLEGLALVEMPAEVGIAKLLKMKMTVLGDRNDLKRKAELFRGGLREGGLVYAHIKGPDEFGHDGDGPGKKKCVETIDRDFFSTVVEDLKGAVLAVSCDHATPSTLKMHSADPVPLLLTCGEERDRSRFTEKAAANGSLGHIRGRDVLPTVLSEGRPF